MVSQRGVLSSVYDVRCSPPHQFNRDAIRGRGHTLKLAVRLDTQTGTRSSCISFSLRGN